ncbi:unnamed protein product [Hydatigera taeniaeformis]|uniref:Protein kinase domain-containing protein n=1 Tax=Hydatigena taeniaeformis TaxID=6205 RepID=A0A0R3X2W8_HYDTA|nr:unnamed protein product [Hydatigera taeniaeformis]
MMSEVKYLELFVKTVFDSLVKGLVLAFFSQIALSFATKILYSVKENDTVTLNPCPIPEVAGSIKARWEWYCNYDLITSDSSPFLKLHEHNGSLTIVARKSDVNHAYRCQGFTILPNGTEIEGPLLSYVIAPIFPAFLEHNLRNVTVARNEQYVIPCVAGGIESTLEIKVDGRKWPRKSVRVFDDTLIECRAFNSAGEERASAFLSVEPGEWDLPLPSEIWKMLRAPFSSASLPPPTAADGDNDAVGIHAKTHLNHLSDRSACQPFVLSTPSVCSSILQAESPAGSVYTVSTSRLLRAESTNQILASAFRKWDSLVPPNTPPSSPHLRCLQQAKRLVCLLVFPRCLEVEAYIEDLNSFDVNPDTHFLSPREFLVCQQHCFLITALICAASFNTSHDRAVLWNYKPNVTQGEGWQELLARGENISQILPNDGCAGLSRMVPTDMSTFYQEQFHETTTSACQSLSFAALSARRAATLSVSQNCYNGYGEDYGGIVPGPTSCLPWVELDYVKSDSPDPLTSLSPSIIPLEALEPLPTNYSVCRNPLGLAPKPFCVGTNRSIPGILTLLNCSLLVDCAFADTTSSMNHMDLNRHQQRINMISITATICTVFLFLIFFVLAYILRAYRQEKVRISVEEERANRYAQLVTRRERLRETGRFSRCLLRCLYALQDACDRSNAGDEWLCCRRRCCCAETLKKADPTKIGNEDTLEKIPDDEDEEVQHLIKFLRQNHNPERLLAMEEHARTDNRPHLTHLDALSEAMHSVEHVDVESHPPASSLNSYLQPSESSSTETSAILCKHGLHHTHCLVGASNTRFHLDNAFMLFSAGQFMHPKLKQLSYARKLLIEERTLAKSAFGYVILARAPSFPLKRRFSLAGNDLSGEFDMPESSHVVIKTLEFGATPAAEASFFREAELLLDLNHPNIVQIIGICIPLQPYSLIYEYMRDGDLNTFLHHARDPVASPYVPATNNDDAGSDFNESSTVFLSGDGTLPTRTLIRFALDVCEAMIYLSGKLYVHRYCLLSSSAFINFNLPDLATRNCLVNGSQVKLADFSMCRRLPHNCTDDLVDLDSEAPLAVRWLPLESILQGHFNVDTDVWSFGVLLWELFTFGQIPYGNVDLSEVI